MKNFYPFAVYSAKGLGILSILYMSKIIDAQDLGFYGYFTLIIQALSYLTLGIQFQLINKGSSKEKNLPELISQSISLQIFIYLIGSLIITVLIKTKLIILPTKFTEIALYISIIISGLVSNLNITLVKVGRLTLSYLALIIENLSYPVILSLWLLFYKKIDFETFVLIYLISKTIPTFLLFYTQRRYFKIDFILKFDRYKEIIQSGVKLLIYNSFFTLFLILLQLQSSFSLDVGGFGRFKIAFLISTIPSLLISGVEQILYPKFYNNLYHESDKIEKSLQYGYLIVLFTTIGVIFPLTILVNKYFVEIQLNTIYLLLIMQFAYNKCYVRKLKLVTRMKELILASIFGILSIPLIVVPYIFPDIKIQQIIWIATLSLFIFDLVVSIKSQISWGLMELIMTFILIISVLIGGSFHFLPLIFGSYLVLTNKRLIKSLYLTS